MYEFVKTTTGWFHLIIAIFAMIVGAVVLATPKGTRSHKKAGYVYVISMLLVCSSAMFMYRLTGKFGIFHVTAIIGFVTLFCGIAPLYITTFPKKYKAFIFGSCITQCWAFMPHLLLNCW